MSYKNSTTNFTKGPQPPRFIMNGHKKTRASCLLLSLRHLEIARVTIIEQQPALIRYNTVYPSEMVDTFLYT